jgi:hypothetical protein
MVRVDLCREYLRKIVHVKPDQLSLCEACRVELNAAYAGRPRRGLLASYVRFWFTPYIWILKIFGAIEEILKWYREGASTS